MPTQPLDVVAQVVSIAVSEIEIGERLRPINEVWARALGGIMAAEGQKTPIEVCRLPGSRRFTLVSGGHRLAGARFAKIPKVLAVVVGAGSLERREREISENLWRMGLDPIDRAAFIADLVALFKERAGIDPAADGRAASARVRWQKLEAADATERVSVAYGWSEEIGAKIGVSGRTIQAELSLYRSLLPDVAALLRGHPIASKTMQLRALARLCDSDQRTVARLIVDGDAKGPADALAIIKQKPRPDEPTKAWSAFVGGWGRMSGAMRRDALLHLKTQGLPRGVTINIEGVGE